MSSSTLIILTVALAVILLAVMFFLPWLSADPSAYIPPWLEQFVGLVNPVKGDKLSGIISTITSLLGDQVNLKVLDTLEAVVELLENTESIKPIDLFRLDFASLLVKAAIILPIVTAVFSLVTALLIWMQSDEGVQIFSLITAVIGGVAVLLLIVSIPSLLRLGSTDDIGVALAVTIFNVRLAYGFWLSLGLTLALTSLSILSHFAPPISSRSRKRYQSRTYR